MEKFAGQTPASFTPTANYSKHEALKMFWIPRTIEVGEIPTLAGHERSALDSALER